MSQDFKGIKPLEEKLKVKYTMFATLTKGGYLRTFESVSHPGIEGAVQAETRGSPAVRKFFYKDKEYKTVAEVLAAYKKDPPPLSP